MGDNTRFLKEAFEDLNRLIGIYQEVIDSANGSISEDLVAKVTDMRKEVDIDYLSDEVPTAIDQALDGISRVSEIVQSMKEFSHPGSESKLQVDLNHAIESTVTVSKNEWKYCANLVTEFDESLPEVPCLPGEFNQVILNILVNAAHAIESRNGENSTDLGDNYYQDDLWRRVCRDPHKRYRLWHARGCLRQSIRAVLHDQGGWQGNRPGTRYSAICNRR